MLAVRVSLLVGLTSALLTASAPASVTLTSSANPSRLGTPLAISATVIPASASGSVTFYDGVSILGSAKLTGGVGTLRTALLSSGKHALRAYYPGDANYSAASSSTLTQTVNELPTNGLEPPLNEAANDFVVAIAAADFNEDGKIDLIEGQDAGLVAIPVSNLTLLLGNGDGTFQTPVYSQLTGSILALATGDFNADGHTDLAVLFGSQTASGVAILNGNGDGTFQAPLTTSVVLSGLVVADFNGDGKADIAGASFDSATVLLGNGDGTFQSPMIFDAGLVPLSTVLAIAAGDLNGDGKADLVVTQSGDDFLSVEGAVAVLIGNGDGSFQPPSLYPANAAPLSVNIADLNNDGMPDLIVVNQGAVGNYVSVLLATGPGIFAPPVSYTTGTSSNYDNPLPAPSVAVDLNGDGNVDVALAGGPNLSVLPGTGTGSLLPATSYAVQSSNGSLVAADFNGDGRADLAVPVNLYASIFLGQPLACSTPASFPIAFDANGGQTTVPVNVSSPSCSWTATAGAGWFTVSPTSGTGPANLTVTVLANTGSADRSASLVLTDTGFGTAARSVTQAFTTTVFADVPPGTFYFDAANILLQKQITAGCSTVPLDFCPDDAVTRADAAILIVRSVFGSDTFTYSPIPYFADVPLGSFGFPWIQKLYELGITGGCTATDFCPNDDVTRDEMAIFIIRARYGATVAFSDMGTPYFVDVATAYFAYPWIERLAEDNITGGCQAALFCPDAPVLRGEAAILITRGLFNLFLPPSQPILISITPATIAPGATGTYVITGVNTNFQDAEVLNPIPGVTAGTGTALSPTVLSVQLTAASDATPGPVSIGLLTGAPAVLPNGLTILGNP